MESITDEDSKRAKLIWENFGSQNLGQYHDVESDTLLLEDIFESFRNKFLGNYELNPAHFLSVPELAWQACLKKTEVELELLIC